MTNTTNTTVWIVTQRVHYAGMDEAQTFTLGAFTDDADANAVGFVHDFLDASIADETEVTKIDIDAALDDDFKQAIIENLLDAKDGVTPLDPELEAALTRCWPEWRDVWRDAVQQVI